MWLKIFIKIMFLLLFKCLELECRPHRSPKVVGGRLARPNEYPYMAAIFVRVRETPVFAFICGGSIYNRNYVITAGHCLQKKDGSTLDPKGIRVFVGSNKVRLLLREETKDLFPVNATYIHQGFDASGIVFVINDIAMLKLQQPLNYSKTVRKLRVASPQESSIDGIGDVIGWGRTEVYLPIQRPSQDQKDLPTTLELKTARLRIISNRMCTIRHFLIIPNSILCVGSEGLLDSQSACFGDSGGPLACQGPSGPYLCGLVSTGLACGLRFTPGFYTRVADYSTWLHRIGGVQ